MAYFDSAKNRAKWQKELAALRLERERRAAGGSERTEGGSRNGHRVRITYNELEAEEYEAVRAQKLEQQKERERRREMSAETQNRQKEHKNPEKSL